MKKYIKSFLLFFFIVTIGFMASSYYFGSDVFNVESVINLIENKQSTSVLKIDDTQYNADGGFFYSSLNDEEKRVYDQIYSRTKNQKTTVKIHSDLSSQKILDIASFVFSEHPEIFWLTGSYSIDTSGVLTLKSVYSADEIEALSKEIKAKASSILQNTNDGMSDYEKSLYFYDYIVKNISYSEEAINSSVELPWASSLVGPFTKGKCTCMGYAKAYQYLLQLSGINCALVFGNAETPQGKSSHAWVIQECDDACYYTDPTWGDSFEQEDREDYVNHSYFCVDENELEKTHSIQNKDRLPKCTSNAASYFIKNSQLYSTYRRSDVKKAVKKSIENKSYYIELKYTNDAAYKEACDDLFTNGHLYFIMVAASLTDKSIDPKTTKYSNNDKLYTITVFFD